MSTYTRKPIIVMCPQEITEEPDMLDDLYDITSTDALGEQWLIDLRGEQRWDQLQSVDPVARNEQFERQQYRGY